MESPLITIYITNYNYGKYIRKAVDSVLNQTIQDFEIIIIDDGSTDKSKEIIEEYASHSKIKVIFQKNKGLNVTNNIAMRTGQGKYIMRLDADDYLDENALLVMSNLLEKDEELGLVFPDYYMIDSEENVQSVEIRHSFKKDVSLYDQPAHGACTMIRMDFLRALGGYDERYKCQDGYELWVKFTAKYKVQNINTPLFYYRQHGSNLTSNEERILNTRAEIKDNYVNQNINQDEDHIVIIPVRGSKYNANNIAYTKIGERTILDWKIEAALGANKISKVIISSPDKDIEQYINENYSTDKLYFHKRDEKLSRLNIGLIDTIDAILDVDIIRQRSLKSFSILSIEHPFIKSATIDDAVNTMMIFKSDSLISVRPDTDLFFQHQGMGMKPILNQDNFSRLEREALYRYTGGIIATDLTYYNEHKQVIGGKVGHIVVDKKAAHAIRTSFDIEVANRIVDL